LKREREGCEREREGCVCVREIERGEPVGQQASIFKVRLGLG